MKRLFLLIAAAFLWNVTISSAQDAALFWKYREYDGSMSFTVPGLLIDFGSLFIREKEERRLLRRVNKVRIMYFEGNSPITDRDWKKFEKRAKRRNLEQLIEVRDKGTRIKILAKDRGATLKKVVAIVQSDDEFVMVGLKGNLRWEDVQRVIDKYEKETPKKNGKKKKEVIPDVISVPVSRV